MSGGYNAELEAFLGSLRHDQNAMERALDRLDREELYMLAAAAERVGAAAEYIAGSPAHEDGA